MENQIKWGAKPAVVSAIVISIIVFIVHSMFGFGIFRFSSWRIDLGISFPYYMVVVPIVEVLILVVVLSFARIYGADLTDLGLKKIAPSTLARVMAALMLLYLVTMLVTFVLTNVVGPDPLSESFSEASVPQSFLQLVVYVVIYMVLVGPAEELAFRGFIQRGLANSFGAMKGLLLASLLFGLPHMINYPYNAATATATGLVLGYVWQRTGQNTTATAILHGVFNSIGVILVYVGTI
jgi:membrane protease YdiL (CAAX protease family)